MDNFVIAGNGFNIISENCTVLQIRMFFEEKDGSTTRGNYILILDHKSGDERGRDAGLVINLVKDLSNLQIFSRRPWKDKTFQEFQVLVIDLITMSRWQGEEKFPVA